MRYHKLKTWPEFFNYLIHGTKTCEIRRADRDFQIGDFLLLQEWVPSSIVKTPDGDASSPSYYTGRWFLVEVLYMQDAMVPEGPETFPPARRPLHRVKVLSIRPAIARIAVVDGQKVVGAEEVNPSA